MSDTYTIAYCYSCHREFVARRGGTVCTCTFCGDDHPSKNVDKYATTDAAGELLVRADAEYKFGKFENAALLYREAAEAEPDNAYANLGAALAEFKVVLNKHGEPIKHKRSRGKFTDNEYYKRAARLTDSSMRGEYYAELGAKIDGLYGGLDRKALEARGFEYAGTELTGYSGKDVDVDIPDGTTKIDAIALYLADNVRSVHVPASVTEIEALAFSAKLDKLTVDAKNKIYEAKNGCLIDKRTKTLIFACKNATVPSDGSVEIIGEKAFDMHKSVESVTIPAGVTEIGTAAFDCCTAMTSISIPSTVTKICGSAFVNCYKLEDINVDADNPAYYTDGGCLIERASGTLVFGRIGCTIPTAVKIIGTSAFGGDHKALRFPASVERGIEDGFCGCEILERLEVDPENKTYFSQGDCIIERASGTLVRGCSNSVIPRDVVKKIGDHAFASCKALTEIEVPSGVTELCLFAFSYCSALSEIKLPETLETIDSYAFEGCSALETVEIPNGVKMLGVFVFSDCANLESLYIPASVNKIYNCITSGCDKLREVVFEDKNGWTANDAPLEPDELEGRNAIELLDSWAELAKDNAT